MTFLKILKSTFIQVQIQNTMKRNITYEFVILATESDVE